MKDVASCDKPRGAAKQALIRGCLNGSARHGEAMTERTETQVGAFGEPGEVKHLSSRRKRNQTRFP
jgi:hypothetical protein